MFMLMLQCDAAHKPAHNCCCCPAVHALPTTRCHFPQKRCLPKLARPCLFSRPSAGARTLAHTTRPDAVGLLYHGELACGRSLSMYAAQPTSPFSSAPIICEPCLDPACCRDANQMTRQHDWGEDENGRDNHERVGRVAAALQDAGLAVWFDENE